MTSENKELAEALSALSESVDQQSKPRLSKRQRSLIRVVLAAASIVGGNVVGRVIADEVIAAEASAQMAFESFQNPNQVSQQTRDTSYNSALDVSVGDAGCTGAVINGYLVTATHCLREDSNIVASFRRQELPPESYRVDTSEQWVSNERHVRDLVIARLNGSQELPGAFLSYIANDSPEPGSRAVVSTLAGDRIDPIQGTLTYLFEWPAITDGNESDQMGSQWVYAVGPENSPAAVAGLCEPGASGSLIMDDLGHLGVLTNVASPEHMSEEDWNLQFTNYQLQSGSDLAGVSAFCIATPLTRDVFNEYLDVLNQ